MNPSYRSVLNRPAYLLYSGDFQVIASVRAWNVDEAKARFLAEGFKEGMVALSYESGGERYELRTEGKCESS